MDENLFDYIILFAFSNAVTYDNKAEITMDGLGKYYNYIASKLIKQMHKNKSAMEKDVILAIEKQARKGIKKEIARFADKYSLFFIFDGKALKLKDVNNMTAMALIGILDSFSKNNEEFSAIGNIISSFDCDLRGLEILGADGVKKQIEAYFRFEENLEKIYSNCSNNTSLIDYYMAIGYSFIHKISKLNSDNITSYHRLFSEVHFANYGNKSIEFLNREWLDNDEFYLNTKYIDDDLDNQYQRAIFSDDALFHIKAKTYLDNLFDLMVSSDMIEDDEDILDSFIPDEEEDECSYEEDSYIDEFEDPDDEGEYQEGENDIDDDSEMLKQGINNNYIFYLSLIREFDDYQRKEGQNEELVQVKNRLLYLMDNVFYKLYDDENRKNYLEHIIDTSKSNDFYCHYAMSRLFFFDLVNNNLEDYLALKKILFITNYYHLTKDKRIERMITKYQNSKIGKLLYNYLFLGLPINIDKDLPKRKTKKNNGNTEKK